MYFPSIPASMGSVCVCVCVGGGGGGGGQWKTNNLVQDGIIIRGGKFFLFPISGRLLHFRWPICAVDV